MTCTDETAWRTKVSAELRHAMRHFATGVTVISWVGADGGLVGTTANAVSSLCLDPPLVLVCFDLAGQALEAVRAHGAFAINVLAAAQQDLSANFARRGIATDWDGVRYRPRLTGGPRRHGVLTTVECAVENRLPGGDYEIVSAGCATLRQAPRYGPLRYPATRKYVKYSCIMVSRGCPRLVRGPARDVLAAHLEAGADHVAVNLITAQGDDRVAGFTALAGAAPLGDDAIVRGQEDDGCRARRGAAGENT